MTVKNELKKIFAQMQREAADLLGLAEFSERYFIKGRSEVTSLLMLYSCVEVAYKVATTSILKESFKEETNVQTAIHEVIRESIEADASGVRSRFLLCIQGQVIAAYGEAAREDGRNFKRSEHKFITQTLEKMQRFRNQVAHAACRYMDKSLTEVDENVGFTLKEAFGATLTATWGVVSFLRLHQIERAHIDELMRIEHMGPDDF